MEICLFWGIYQKNNCDMANPSVATLGLFSVSLALALIGNVSWENYFSPKSLFVFVLGSLIIVIANISCKVIVRKPKIIPNRKLGISRIEIKKWKRNILILITVVLTIGYVYDVMKRGQVLGVLGLKSIYQAKQSVDQGNFIFRQGIKITMATAYVNGFVFVNNTLANEKKKADLLYIIPVICGCVCSVFTGVRTEIFRLIIALALYTFVLYREKKNWYVQRVIDKRTRNKIIIVLIGFLLLFYVMRDFVKSSDISENNAYGIVMYLAYYIGSPWLVINKKIIEGLAIFKGILFGELTFATLYVDLIDFGILSDSYHIEGEAFVSIDHYNKVSGNADTIFGQPLVDFGIIGMLVFIFILYTVLSRYYYKYIRNTYGSYKRNRRLIIYAFIFYIVGISFYSNALATMVSFYYAITFVLILIIYFFYFGCDGKNAK